MNTLVIYGLIVLVVGILTIATTSIGINCYNNCPTEKESKKSNFNYLVMNLVLSILLTLGSMFFLYQLTVLKRFETVVGI